MAFFCLDKEVLEEVEVKGCVSFVRNLGIFVLEEVLEEGRDRTFAAAEFDRWSPGLRRANSRVAVESRQRPSSKPTPWICIRL